MRIPIAPTGNERDTKTRFGAAWDGYTRGNAWFEPAFDDLRPYYIHAIELLTADEQEPDYINADTLASHIAAAYIFGDEDLADDESLISIFYSTVTPATGAKVARSIANALEDGDQLDSHWDSIRQLWRWRLDYVESTVGESHQASDYQREFQQFFKCLQESPEASITQEKELIERSSPYLVCASFGFRIIEEWLADQSEEHPQEAIEIYQKLVEATTDANWLEIARTSQDELREQLYKNAATHTDEAEKTAYKIANRFAAEGYERDRTFLDEHLGRE